MAKVTVVDGLGPNVGSHLVKLFVSLLCVCAILPAKAVPEMTYTVFGGTLNTAYSLTDSGTHATFIT